MGRYATIDSNMMRRVFRHVVGVLYSPILRVASNLSRLGGARTSALVLAIGLSISWGITIMPAQVWAQQSSSTNYSVDQAFFGNGGQLGVSGDGCSTNYCAKSAAGEMGVGNVSSTNYQAQPGHNVDREISLEVVVNNPSCPDYGSTNVNLGYLTTSAAAKAAVNFSVKAYLSGGYVVRTVGTPPTYASKTLNALTTGGASSPGTEQFGINLRANTTPSVGSDPSSLPDNSFGYGVAASGYNTVNTFRYNNGEIIASSPKSSGATCFTMSYLYNVSGLTPAGEYKFAQSIVATASY